jgi:hypothetical protein
MRQENKLMGRLTNKKYLGLFPDSRNLAFNVSEKSLSERISKIALHSSVPKEVASQIEIYKKLCLHSFYVYEFASLAEHLSFMVIETALKERLRIHYFDVGFSFRDKLSAQITVEKPHSLAAFQKLLNNKRFLGIEGWFKRGVYLNELLDWAIEQKIVQCRFKGEGAVLGNLRNHIAHPIGLSFHVAGVAISGFDENVDFINSIFSGLPRRKRFNGLP